MKSKINKNNRIVYIPCFECGNLLEYCIKDEVIVRGEGKIACNIPGAVCSDCVEPLLDRVADPPGLICIDKLSPELAQGLLETFDFLLPRSKAIRFFKRIFPEI